MFFRFSAFVYYVFVLSIIAFIVFKNGIGPAPAMLIFAVSIYLSTLIGIHIVSKDSSYITLWIIYRGLPLWVFQCMALIQSDMAELFLKFSLGAVVMMAFIELAFPLQKK